MFQAKEESFQLPIPKDIAALLSENENLCQIFQQKFGCQTFVYSGDTRSNRNAAEVRYLKRLNNGITISVWKDDLTTHRVDAVVNAANDKLQHVGGLAYALALAGGSVIEKESKEIIHKQQKVNPGDAVVTSAGSLPCKKVIHAVGPIYKSYQGNEDINACFILEKAVETILNLCVKEGFKSVAIPALSSGIFQFPLPLCAKIIAESIRKWTSVTHSRVLLTDIHLVNNDDPTVTEMQKWCRNIFGPNDKGEVMIDQQLGNVTLVIKKGFIEKEQVDVIVNTISSDLDLTQGEISKAILREAGKQLQKDILLNRRISKDILRTAAFNMNCKEVYHVICSPWKGKKSEEYFGFFPFVENYNHLPSMPFIEFQGKTKEVIMEAKNWFEKVLTIQEKYIIQDKHIYYFGDENHQDLSVIQNFYNVSLKESQFVAVCTNYMQRKQKSTYRGSWFSGIALTVQPWQIIVIQKIENPLLKIHFDLKKENMDGKEKTLYQCVPAKFCSLVCRAGFQKVYSQTNDLTCGDGIYFSENLTKVVENQSKYCEDDHFIYIFEARVATGKSTHGSSGLTIPPATSSEPLTLYDSVTHGASTHVIFNSAQAYPLYLITCSEYCMSAHLFELCVFCR
uniref:Macro domain-containing protein n=1 Tax=Erpetoichthys calabaricus TaxID=27687 RepID=A0A8C4S162_ERPCA